MYQATVTAYMTSTTKDKVSDEIVKQTKDYELSPEVYYGTDMETELMNEEFAALGMSIAIAIFLVFVVMALQFNSIAVSILIMMEVPFAVVGSVLYLILTRSKISNIGEQISNVLQASDHLTDDYVTKKILTLLGDGDLADDIIKEKDAEDMQKINVESDDGQSAPDNRRDNQTDREPVES